MAEFTDLLDELRIPYHVGDKHTRPGWVNFACVRCGRDPYMGYNTQGRYTTCWACGYVPLWEVLKCFGLSEERTQEVLGSLPRTYHKEMDKTGSAVQWPGGMDSLSRSPMHRKYLYSRGLDPYEVQNKWDVRALGIGAGTLKWRLFIPVRLHGEVQSWTTRAIGTREPRYLSARDDQSRISITNLIYGMDHVFGTVLVVEGPVDVWSLGYGAVALMGSRASPAQILQLSRVPVRYVCLDNEPVAQDRAKELCELLSVYDGTTVNLTLGTGKDPASVLDTEREALRRLLTYGG